MATAVHVDVTRALSAERAPAYLNLLYALLLMRRGHELEPRHDDLYARVLAPQRLLGGAYDPDEYGRDLDQLVDWGCIERMTEPRRLRGYKDNRRVQYRYRISDDAVALIEWLEARLAAAVEGRVRDSRDRLADIVGALKEYRRLLDGWRRGERDPDSARRCYYLLELVADAALSISDELLAFRAEMVAFSQRPYDVGTLREILAWLERYVDLYIRRIRELRTDIRDRLAAVRAPRYLAAVAGCAAVVEAERAAAPRIARAPAPLRAPGELVEAIDGFFRHGGRLQALCRAIDDTARAVLVKMHRHVRELERRSARLCDLRGAIRALARSGDDRAAGYADYLLASAHGRFEGRPGTRGHRVAPPVPRNHQLAGSRRAAARALAPKRATPDEARALRAKALAELGDWVAGRVLAGRKRVRLSEIELSGAGDLRRWMEVARARHLGAGRDLGRIGVAIAGVGGRARLGDAEVGLDAPDCEVERDAAGEGERGEKERGEKEHQ